MADNKRAGEETLTIPATSQFDIEQKFKQKHKQEDSSKKVEQQSQPETVITVTEENYQSLKASSNLTDEQQEALLKYELNKVNASQSTDNKNDDNIEIEGLPQGVTVDDIINKTKEIEAKAENDRTEDEKAFLEEFKPQLGNITQPASDDKVSAPINKVFEKLNFKTDKDISTEEGLQEALADLAFNAAKNILAKDKELNDFYNHRLQGGTVETFKKSRDVQNFENIEIVEFTNLDIDRRDKVIENIRNVIKEDLTRKGLSDEIIDVTIRSIENESDEKFYNYGIKAKHAIVEADKAVIQQQQQRQLEDQAIQKENQRKYYEAVNTGDYGVNVSIPDSIHNKFRHEASNPENLNKTLDEKWSKLTQNQLALLDLMVYSDFEILPSAGKNNNLNIDTMSKNNKLKANRDYSSMFGSNNKKETTTPESKEAFRKMIGNVGTSDYIQKVIANIQND